MDQQTFDLFAGFAHDLRTPLGAISGYAELLRLGAHGPVPDAQAELLGRILQNQRRMVTLLDDMAAYSAVLADTRAVERHAVPVLPLLHDAVDRATPAAQLREIQVQVTHDGSPDLTASTDPACCTEILDVLLSDAMQHAATGDTITVAVTTAADEVRVIATAPAETVSSAQAITLFEPFRSVTRARDAHPLALPRARAIAQRLGGELLADTDAAHRALVLVLPRTAATP